MTEQQYERREQWWSAIYYVGMLCLAVGCVLLGLAVYFKWL